MLKDDTDVSTIDFASALSKAGGKELQVLLMGSAGKFCAGNNALGSPKLRATSVFVRTLVLLSFL